MMREGFGSSSRARNGRRPNVRRHGHTVLIGIALLLIAWLLRRQARRQIGHCLSGRILYTDTETHREILTSDRYNLSGKLDYILGAPARSLRAADEMHGGGLE
jgi:hypothetical protein